MASIPLDSSQVNGDSVQHYDVIVIGAGFSGIANIYRLRKDGFKVHCFESGTVLTTAPIIYQFQL
jgi:ribulose 1,5-bisphosphate synthetase/thiazole synthase